MPNRQAGLSSSLSRKQGFTLLELIFALSVVAVLATLSVAQYKRMSAEKDIELVRYNVDLIFQAANQCYWIKRSGPAFCTKTYLQTLPPGGLGIWPNLFLKNNKLTSSDGNYNFSIIPTPGVAGSFSIKVNVTFPSVATGNTALLQWYVSKLNASGFTSNILTWSRMPTYSTPTADTNLWISNAQLQQFRSIVQVPP